MPNSPGTRGILVTHRIEIFDADGLRPKSKAGEAAENAVRLGGIEQDNRRRLSMAHDVMAVASAGVCTLRSLTVAALDWQSEGTA
jgi:hypothetical protein